MKIFRELIFNAILKDFNKDGFTSPLTGELKRYIVASTHNDKYTLEKLENQCKKLFLNFKNVNIGGWTDTNTGINYLDISTSFDDINEAIKFGMKNKQIAIFDIINFEEIIIQY